MWDMRSKRSPNPCPSNAALESEMTFGWFLQSLDYDAVVLLGDDARETPSAFPVCDEAFALVPAGGLAIVA